PALTRSRPLTVELKLPPVSVPPFTHSPAVLAIVGATPNWAPAPECVSLSRPLVRVRLPLMLMGATASSTAAVLLPLLTTTLLKAVLDAPPIVAELEPVKLMVLAVVNENEPSLVQFPAMLWLRLVPAAKIAF